MGGWDAPSMSRPGKENRESTQLVLGSEVPPPS